MKNTLPSLLLCALAASLLIACSKKTTGADGTAANTPAVDSTILIELHTGPCFGYCPVYRLAIRESGRVDYEGIRFAQVLGKKQVQLTGDELSRLKKQVKATDLWQYPDNIPSNIADAPYTTMKVYRDTTVKMVRGSIDRPKPLLDLEALVVKTVEAHDINLTKGVPPPRDR